MCEISLGKFAEGGKIRSKFRSKFNKWQRNFKRNFQHFVCVSEISNENLVWRSKFRSPFVVITRGSQNAECKLRKKKKTVHCSRLVILYFKEKFFVLHASASHLRDVYFQSVPKTLWKKSYLRLYLTQIVHSNSKMLFL